jgi:hypothetical protein
MIADLLAVAARVLDWAGELPPLTVTCSPAERLLPPLTLTPASLGMREDDQAALVRAVAATMGWPLRRLPEVEGGWTSTGTVDGVVVQALAAPLSGVVDLEARITDATTAEHAELLRALIDWSASLAGEAKALEVREDLDNGGAFAARLVLATGADVSRVSGLVIAAGGSDGGWSGFRGIGVLPTGHALTVSVGM